jgi:hypothetical protein
MDGEKGVGWGSGEERSRVCGEKGVGKVGRKGLGGERGNMGGGKG